MSRFLRFIVKTLYCVILGSLAYDLLKNVQVSHNKFMEKEAKLRVFAKDNWNFEYKKIHDYIGFDLSNITHMQGVFYLFVFAIIMTFFGSCFFTFYGFIIFFKFNVIEKGLYLYFNQLEKLVVNKDFVELFGIFSICLFLMSTSSSKRMKCKISCNKTEEKPKSKVKVEVKTTSKKNKKR